LRFSGLSSISQQECELEDDLSRTPTLAQLRRCHRELTRAIIALEQYRDLMRGTELPLEPGAQVIPISAHNEDAAGLATSVRGEG